jgi:hypothetical protein
MLNYGLLPRLVTRQKNWSTTWSIRLVVSATATAGDSNTTSSARRRHRMKSDLGSRNLEGYAVADLICVIFLFWSFEKIFFINKSPRNLFHIWTQTRVSSFLAPLVGCRPSGSMASFLYTWIWACHGGSGDCKASMRVAPYIAVIPDFYIKTKYSSYAWPKINCFIHTVKSIHI